MKREAAVSTAARQQYEFPETLKTAFLSCFYRRFMTLISIPSRVKSTMLAEAKCSENVEQMGNAELSQFLVQSSCFKSVLTIIYFSQKSSVF